MSGNKPKTVKYFSAFTGIGGFELGILQAYVDSLNGNKNGKIKKNTQADDVKGERLVSAEGKDIGAKKGPAVQLPDFGSDKRAPHCVGYSEIDKYACQIYQAHFPEHKNYGDITKINASDLPDFDVFVGGFPCQSFSIAGKRQGFEDTRGTLFFDICRIVKKKRPKYLLLENVKGLLSHDNGRTFKTIITSLTELGYCVEWQVLNSKNFGVPQNRERVFIVGYLGKPPCGKVFPLRKNDGLHNRAHESKRGRTQAQIGTTLKAAGNIKADDTFVVETPVAPTIRATEYKHGDNQTLVVEDFFPGRIRTFKESPTLRSGRAGLKIIEPPHKHGEIRVYKNQVPTMQARWGTGGNNVPYVANAKIRRLTPLECERLQGFPDGWTAEASDSHRYKTLGNAVTVNVIKTVFKKMFYKDN